MSNIVIFHLKRFWEGRDLWEEIKSGKKTSEWRDFSTYWQRRLLSGYLLLLWSHLKSSEDVSDINCTRDLKVCRAWFVVGYPKYNIPRLEADIVGLIYHPDTEQLEIKFVNVEEVTR